MLRAQFDKQHSHDVESNIATHFISSNLSNSHKEAILPKIFEPTLKYPQRTASVIVLFSMVC